MMTIKTPPLLEDVKGETLGEKMEVIGACLNTIDFSIGRLTLCLKLGSIEVDSEEHEEWRGRIDTHFEEWERKFESAINTGIGDLIRGTMTWSLFAGPAERVFDGMLELIKEEHAQREMEGK